LTRHLCTVLCVEAAEHIFGGAKIRIDAGFYTEVASVFDHRTSSIGYAEIRGLPLKLFDPQICYPDLAHDPGSGLGRVGIRRSLGEETVRG
jgi:hypothetical protein